MGSRQVNLLEMVFAGPGGSRCAVASQDCAQACILDLDAVGAGEELFRQRAAHPERPLVLTAVHRPPEAVVAGDLYLAKPIRVDALVDAVGVVLARLSAPHRLDEVPARHVEGRHGEAKAPARDDAPPSLLTVASLLSVEPVESVESGTPADLLPPVEPVESTEAVEPVESVGAATSQESVEPRVTAPPAASTVEAPQVRRPRPASRLRSLPSPSQPLEIVVPAPQGDAGTTPSRVSGVGPAPSVPAPSVPAPAGSQPRRPGEPARPAAVRLRGGAPAGRAVGTYEPARYLQGLVVRARQEALRRRQAVHLEGPWPTLTLLAASGTAVVPGGAAALRPYGPQYDLPSHARVTFTPAPLFSPHHPDAVDLDTLIWELALAAAAGRIPEGVSLQTPCSLRDWPNFTRLKPTPGAMSVAALWIREPVTLADTARVLDLPLPDVCSFFSAAQAIGLIAPAEDDAPPPPPPPALAAGPRRGLLRRVFDKLRVPQA